MKRFGVLLLCVLVISAATGFAAGRSDDESGMPKVAFISDIANPSQAFSAKMFTQLAPRHGLDLQVLDSTADAQTQAQVVSNAIAQQLDAIFINPNDVNAIVPVLLQAKQAGLIIGLFSSDLPSANASARDFFVGVNDTEAGETAARAFIEHFPNGARILEIGGQSGHDAQIKRHDGFARGIEGTNIEVIDFKATQQWATAEALSIMEDMIVKYGDEFDGVFCHWDNGATGVIEALKAAGMTGKYIVAVDGNRAGFDQVTRGEQSVTIMQNFEAQADKTLSLTETLLSGESVPEINLVPLDIVSLDNIDDFTVPEW